MRLALLTRSFLRHLAAGLGLWCAASIAWGQATAPAALPYTLRVVGGLASLNQYTRNEEPFWTTTLPRLSDGKFSATIVPFDRAGVPSGDMLRMIQLGVVPFGTILLSAVSAHYPQLTAPDLAGLNPDMPSLKRNLAAFRPYLEHELRTHYRIESLAVYVYPAQVLFCKQALNGLEDLAGRRVRVSSATQSDFVGAFKGIPVLIAFSHVMSSINDRLIDCVITGTMSGHTVGLHQVTTHIHAMPINWGLAIFGANLAAWSALPPELRALLRAEIPKLEQAIWAESERETALGLACNTGEAACSSARRGRMIQVQTSAQDERKRAEVFSTVVLPRWLERCNTTCATVWNQTIGPAQGVLLPTSP